MKQSTKDNQLENWIRNIQNKDNYYCFEGWKYRLSGTVLELSITADSTKDRNKYRCSAITIGQILKTLSTRIEKEGLHFHTQSFPSIENPEIIATIRTSESSYHLPSSFPKITKGNNSKSFCEWLTQLSGKYQFSLHPINRPEDYHPGFISDKKISWLALTSQSDNPFIWLNLGYWKETILSDAKDHFPETKVTIYDFCKYMDDSASNVDIPANSLLQAFIVFAEEP